MATPWLEDLAAAALARRAPAREQALVLLRSEEAELLDVVAAAAAVRRRFFGNRVKVNSLVALKSGGCPEDCDYCSQRRGSTAEVLAYPWLDPEETAAAAERAAGAGARRVCLVASGRGPNDRDLTRVAATVRAIRQRCPELEVCTSLGLLEQGQAEMLHEVGVDAYNHNLNTSEGRYGEICTTHSYADRLAAAQLAKEAGLSLCSGAIFGLGESDEEVLELAFALRELGPDSVPVNFLLPFEGTPRAGQWRLTPQRCLLILALLRFFFPDTEVRLGAGREIHLRTLAPLALHLANSIFLGDYLTSEGDPGAADLAMIADGGFVLEDGQALPSAPQPVRSRRRGPGTERPANF